MVHGAGVACSAREPGREHLDRKMVKNKVEAAVRDAHVRRRHGPRRGPPAGRSLEHQRRLVGRHRADLPHPARAVGGVRWVEWGRDAIRLRDVLFGRGEECQRFHPRPLRADLQRGDLGRGELRRSLHHRVLLAVPRRVVGEGAVNKVARHALQAHLLGKVLLDRHGAVIPEELAVAERVVTELRGAVAKSAANGLVVRPGATLCKVAAVRAVWRRQRRRLVA